MLREKERQNSSVTERGRESSRQVLRERRESSRQVLRERRESSREVLREGKRESSSGAQRETKRDLVRSEARARDRA